MAYKGAISFGLVYIPVTLTPAVKENDIGFNMLEKESGSRIQYKKTCVDCGGREVPAEDIIKGYQYEKDKYVTFTEEEFEKLKSEKDKNITISQFVNLNEIDPVYFDKAYYVSPTGGEKAFVLLLNAMEKENKAGIAKTVLGTRESLMLLRVRSGVMLANTLFFNDEIQRAPQMPQDKIGKEEFALAKTIIDNMTADFEPEKFSDEYNERLREAIQDKIDGKEISSPRETRPENIVNIMDALKKSVEITKKKSS